MPFIWSEDNEIFMDKNNIILKNQARTFNFELTPVVSFIGSLVAIEVLKLASNKFKPINQWFTWTDNSLIPLKKPDNYSLNSVYSILYGTNYEQKILETPIIIIGAGSIGCEHLKNLVFMNNTRKIIITDFDTITKENIKQQFLYKMEDINKLKTTSATQNINKFNPDTNIIALNLDINNSFDIIYNLLSEEEKSKVCIFSAVDNITTRKFIDDKCFKYNIPFFESGIDGLKGHTQSIIPFITETYSESTDPEHQLTYPICVIKNFPNNLDHLIEWALDNFSFFTQGPITLNNYIVNNNLENISDKNSAIKYIYYLVVKYPLKYNSSNLDNLKLAVKYAVDLFINNYYIEINKLLRLYEPNHEIYPNVLFWSRGKRCPKPIKVDNTNPLHLDFIFNTIFIRYVIEKWI
jgi:ubiquitin-activating enzyme E1